MRNRILQLFIFFITLGNCLSEVTPLVGPIWLNSKGQITEFQDVKELKALTFFDLVCATNDSIWLATSDGLYHYDGYEWIRYGTTNSLPSNFIRTLTLTKSGDLWVGTDQGAGVFSENRFSLIAQKSHLAGPSVRRIVEDPDGILWFCSDKYPDPNVTGGLTYFDGKKWTKYYQDDGLPDDHVYQYFRDSHGHQYVLTRGGVAIKTENQWKKILETELWDLVETKNKQVLGFNSKTNFIFDADKVDFTPHKAPWSFNPPKSLHISSDGNVWGYSLGRWNGEIFDSISTSDAYSLNCERIRQASDGSIWCVDTRTLLRWNKYSHSWREYTELPTPSFVDAQGKILFIGWIASYRQKEGDQFEVIPELAGDVRNMLLDHEGSIWMWPQPGLIRRFHEKYTDFNVQQTGLHTVTGALEDAKKRVWFFGCDSEKRAVVTSLINNQWHKNYVTNSADREMLSAKPDPVSGIWISTIRDRSSLAFVRADFTNDIIRAERVGPSRVAGPSFVVDQQGTLWTYGMSGVFKFGYGNSKWEWASVPELKSTLASDAIEAFGGIWFVFSGGLGGKSGFGVYYNDTWKSVDYEMPAFVNIENSGRIVPHASSYRSLDGALYFAAYRNIHVIPEAGLNSHRMITLPREYLLPNNILKDGQGNLWMQARQQNGSNYVLRYCVETNIPKVVITESALSVKPDGLWRIRLQGISKYRTDSESRWYQYSWRFDQQEFGPFKDFPMEGLSVAGLRPGKHSIEIKAMDECLNVQSIPTLKTFEIEPLSLQHRAWFWPLVASVSFLILALAIVAGYKSHQLAILNNSLLIARDNIAAVNAELQQANSDLEQRVAERTSKLAETVAQLTKEIKERQNAEERRAQAEQQMLQAQKMESLGVMAGGIAHDFNNILTAIIGNAEMMKIQSDSPYNENISEIKCSALRAADLCQKMLAYSGKGRFVLQPVNLSSLVQSNKNIIDMAISKTIEIQYCLAVDLPAFTADESQMRQILMSLVLNASEAIGDQPGTINIRTSVQHLNRDFLDKAHIGRQLPEGPYVSLDVEDTGCGMDVTTMNKIFDPFFSTKFMGRGLGLPAVSGIVRGHKGAISVSSSLGRGSRFTVVFPVGTSTESKPPQNQISKSSISLDSHTTKRLLLVDDEEQVLRVGSIFFKRMGFEVVTAQNGRQAIEITRTQKVPFHIALIDLTMPDLNGIETYRELKHIQPDIRAFLASGYSEFELTEQFAADGLAGFIQKPFSMDSLRSKIFGKESEKSDGGRS